MAELSYQQSSVNGATITTAAASGGGDTVRAHPDGAVLVENGDASPITVTIVNPGNDKYGQAKPDIPITVAAGASKLIGPFPSDLATDGLVSISYSAVTSVTVAAILI